MVVSILFRLQQQLPDNRSLALSTRKLLSLRETSRGKEAVGALGREPKLGHPKYLLCS
jgi:hypothetical protein